MRIVAISGSLRTGSSNTGLLERVAAAMPAGSTMSLFTGLADLPAFNPDLDVEGTPEIVTGFRKRIADCDAVAFSSPEYAHGIVGSLKNALDWLVGSGELYEKPVAMLHVSARGELAQMALRETLTVMTGRIVMEEIVTDPPDTARRLVRGVRARRELPKAIMFDLDETIIGYGQREQLLHDVAQEYAARLAPIAADELVRTLEAAMVAFWADAGRHKVWRQQLAEARRIVVTEAFSQLAARNPALDETFAREFAERFHEHREAQAKFFPDAIETIDELRRRGLKLALITNGAAAMQRAKIERFDLLHRFDHIQIEGEHGFGKPEPEAYTHCLAQLNVTADEAWIVGDNLEWEVAAPQRLGLYAVWHDHLGDGLPPDSDIRPDRIIRNLSELLPPEI